MGVTGNKRGVRIAVVILAAVFVFGGGWCASRAEAQDLEGLSLSLGVGLAGSERCFDSMMIAAEVGDRWLATLMTHGSASTCRTEAEPIDANIGAGLFRLRRFGNNALGFGAQFWEHGDVVVGPGSIENAPPPRRSLGIQFCAGIMYRRYAARDRIVIDAVHCSTGGSTAFNRGLNLITIGGRR